LLLLGLAGRLMQAIATSPLLGVPGLVLVVIGIAAAMFLVARRRRLRARTLTDLLALTPTEFEQATASLLQELGYGDVRRTGGSGDLNVDVWARDPNGGRVAVQCKQYAPAHNVGSPDVQTFIGMMYQHHRADRGIFVTTSGFSSPAVALAKQHNILLWDGDELSRQLSDVQTKASTGKSGMRVRARTTALTGVPIGMLLLAGAWVNSDQVTSVEPTTRSASAAVATSVPPAAAPSAMAFARAALQPSAQASPISGADLVQVAHTSGTGVYLRRTPQWDDKLRAFQDGTVLRIIGPDVVTEGTRWRHVAAPDHTEGYVPSEYLDPAR